MTKRSRHRAFWYTPAGPKVLCRPCSEEIQRKTERRATKRKAKPIDTSDTKVVHPPLLDLLVEKQQYFLQRHQTNNNNSNNSNNNNNSTSSLTSSTFSTNSTVSTTSVSSTTTTNVSHVASSRRDETPISINNNNNSDDDYNDDDNWPIEFYEKFLVLIARDLRPGVGEHFFKVFTIVMKSLGSERLILSSPTLLEHGKFDFFCLKNG